MDAFANAFLDDQGPPEQAFRPGASPNITFSWPPAWPPAWIASPASPVSPVSNCETPKEQDDVFASTMNKPDGSPIITPLPATYAPLTGSVDPAELLVGSDMQPDSLNLFDAGYNPFLTVGNIANDGPFNSLQMPAPVQSTRVGTSTKTHNTGGRAPMGQGNLRNTARKNKSATCSDAPGKKKVSKRTAKASRNPKSSKSNKGTRQVMSPQQSKSSKSSSLENPEQPVSVPDSNIDGLAADFAVPPTVPIMENDNGDATLVGAPVDTQSQTTKSATPTLSSEQSLATELTNGNPEAALEEFDFEDMSFLDDLPENFEPCMMASTTVPWASGDSVEQQLADTIAIQENTGFDFQTADMGANFVPDMDPHYTSPETSIHLENGEAAATTTQTLLSFHSHVEDSSENLFVPEDISAPSTASLFPTAEHTAINEVAAPTTEPQGDQRPDEPTSSSGLSEETSAPVNQTFPPTGISRANPASRLHPSSSVMPPQQTGDGSRLPGLQFSNATEAFNAGLGPKWMPQRPDSTLPKDDHERQAIVLRLLAALRNREGAMDRMGHVFKSRWAKKDNEGNYIEFYDPKAMEKVCWDILAIAEDMHKHGPSHLPLHDPEFNKLVEKTREWTFGQRIDTLVQVMHLFKGRCDKLMKGGEVLMYIVNPGEVLATSKTNRIQNDKRQMLLGEGRKAVKEKATGGATGNVTRRTAGASGRVRRALADITNANESTAPDADEDSPINSSDSLENVVLNANGKRRASSEAVDDASNKRGGRRKRTRGDSDN